MRAASTRRNVSGASWWGSKKRTSGFERLSRTEHALRIVDSNTVDYERIVIFALGVVLAGGASRVVRSATLATVANPYVEAGVVLGASHWRIITRHILPNIMPTMIVLATLQLGTAILAEATISYLGIGITNFPTWGQMLSGRTRDLAEGHLYLALFPGLAIMLAVFGVNMLGDALRDVLDPRLRGSR